jgi:hypothetical protein
MFAGIFVQSQAFSYHLVFPCLRLDKAEVAGSSPASSIRWICRGLPGW